MEKPKPDLWDLVFTVGLALAVYGVSLWSVPFSLILAGLLLVGIGAWGSYRWGS